jgi:ATP-dependent DNA helicase RecG
MSPRERRTRPSAPAALGDPVMRLEGVGPRRAADLSRLGVKTVSDLLVLWPRRHRDRSAITPIPALAPGAVQHVVGTVREVRLQPHLGRDMTARLFVRDDRGELEVLFFHARYLARMLPVGTRVWLSGRVDWRGQRLVMVHPEWERLDEGAARGIVPVYPLAGELSQRWMRALMERVVPTYAPQVADPMPAAVRRAWDLPPRGWALVHLHFPDTPEDLERARTRLVLDEALILTVGVQWLRRRSVGDAPGLPLAPDGPLAERFLAGLPFSLTPGQRLAWREVAQDLASGTPMARLLQGDVGVGKTLVAVLACLAAVDAGVQAAFMAPTELLAAQHAEVLARWMDPLHVSVGLVTGSVRDDTRRQLADGDIKLAVGTQALLSDDVQFQQLGLVVVDEQHRFGVRQRSLLASKGTYPHLLVMTATPIPRSLALTIYGDLLISRIDGYPPGRKPVATRRATRQDRRDVYQEVLEAVRRGEQAFVVCPFVDPSDSLDAKSAVQVYEGMRTIPGWRVGLLHGRLPPAAKEAVMVAFRAHDLDVLVATTIVEVGVDVPNATVMVVEDADRFGLAELHQLRGRVGRGSKPGRCILVADPTSEDGEARLNALVECQDGFELAERDLAIRGPGEVLGLKQHGAGGFALADPMRDLERLQTAQRMAAKLLDGDPELSRPDNRALRGAVLDALGEALPATVLH